MTQLPSAVGRDVLAGRILVLVAAILWSTSGFFAKAPWFADWPEAVRPTVFVFWRALFAGAVLLPVVRRPRFHLKYVPMLVAFGLMNFTYLSGMVKTSAANAIWLQMTAPLYVFLVGAFILREPVQPRDWLLLLFGMLGVGLIVGFEVSALMRGGGSIDGVVYALLSGVFYAAVVLSMRILRDEDSGWLIALNHLVTAAVFAPLALTSGTWPSLGQFPILAAFGVFQMGLPYLLFARGLRSIAGHEATGIGLLEPVLVPIWVYLAWHEKPSWWTMVGGGLILAGLLLRYVRRTRVATATA